MAESSHGVFTEKASEHGVWPVVCESSMVSLAMVCVGAKQVICENPKDSTEGAMA